MAQPDRRHDRSRAQARPTRRVTAIDGLRVLAMLAIVVYHANVRWLPGGFIGVTVFFCISGYLITDSLLREVKRTGTIDVIQFYKRRILRLVPLMVVVVAATALICAAFAPQLLQKMRGKEEAVLSPAVHPVADDDKSLPREVTAEVAGKVPAAGDDLYPVDSDLRNVVEGKVYACVRLFHSFEYIMKGFPHQEQGSGRSGSRRHDYFLFFHISSAGEYHLFILSYWRPGYKIKKEKTSVTFAGDLRSC